MDVRHEISVVRFRHPTHRRRVAPRVSNGDGTWITDVTMKTTCSSMLVPEVPGYTKLQREMHDALRAQHPEWINADGKSPRCDYYESLFATLLVSHQAHAREYYDHPLKLTKADRLSIKPKASMPVSYAEARNIVFPKLLAASRQSSHEVQAAKQQ